MSQKVHFGKEKKQKMRVISYSAYGQFKEVVHGDNISSIIDRMLRVTVKVTEHYASDIICDINELQQAVDQKRPYHKFLMFREMGVNSYDSPDAIGDNSEAIQVWELTVAPDIDDDQTETKFQRVRLIRG